MTSDMRQLIKRVENYGPFPLAALDAIQAVRRHLGDFEFIAITRAREMGATWSEIASALGVSRQAAQLRFAKEQQEGRRAP